MCDMCEKGKVWDDISKTCVSKYPSSDRLGRYDFVSY